MRGPAPAELWTFSGWFVLLGVIVVGVAVMALAIWWDNRRNRRSVIVGPARLTGKAPVSRVIYAPQALTEDPLTGIKVRKAPVAGTVSTPDAGHGKHRRPELAA